MKKDKLVDKADKTKTKPAKIKKESIRKRIADGYVAPSSPKDKAPGKIYDTTVDNSGKKGGKVNQHGDIPKAKAKRKK